MGFLDWLRSLGHPQLKDLPANGDTVGTQAWFMVEEKRQLEETRERLERIEQRLSEMQQEIQRHRRSTT